MAKLKARGRTELARFSLTQERQETYSNGEKGEVYTETITRALMSDRRILHKWKRTDGFYPSGEKRPDLVTGWKVWGKLKKDATPEQWIAEKEAKGWTREKTRV